MLVKDILFTGFEKLRCPYIRCIRGSRFATRFIYGKWVYQMTIYKWKIYARSLRLKWQELKRRSLRGEAL